MLRYDRAEAVGQGISVRTILSKISALFRKPRNGSKPVALVSVLTNEQDHRLVTALCRTNGWSLFAARNRAEAERIVARKSPQIVLLDRDIAEPGWRQAMTAFAETSPGSCIMLVSRVIDDYLWNDVVCNGGYDVLIKPLRERELERAIRLARSYWTSANKLAAVKQ